MKRGLALAAGLALAGCNSNAAGFNLMDHVITVGDIVKISAVGLVIAVVGGVAIYFLAAFGRGMSR